MAKPIFVDILIVHNGDDAFAIRRSHTRSGALILSRIKLCPGEHSAALNHIQEGCSVEPDKVTVGRRN